MTRMTRATRLSFAIFLIIGSAGFAALVSKDPELARTIAVGYIAVVLTIFVVDEIWKKP